MYALADISRDHLVVVLNYETVEVILSILSGNRQEGDSYLLYSAANQCEMIASAHNFILFISFVCDELCKPSMLSN